jgi:hypothetical protein
MKLYYLMMKEVNGVCPILFVKIIMGLWRFSNRYITGPNIDSFLQLYFILALLR